MNPPSSTPRHSTLALGTLGVVFGNLGTSPLFAFRECVRETSDPGAVLGAASLILWTLATLVTVKYLWLVLRADNHGEGGILALLTLAASAPRRHPIPVGLAGVFGVALVYGDGIISPSITILSALEGLEVPWPAARLLLLPLALVVLIALFSFQQHDTGRLSHAFGPFMLVWFATLAVLGAHAITQNPSVLLALNPTHALRFLLGAGGHALPILASAFLAVAGAEALYASLGPCGAHPIRRLGAFVVLPALALNYLGQASVVLQDASAALNPFFHLAPPAVLLPLVLLAATAGIIASQALISRVFSLTMQSMQLGYLPRLNIQHTSPHQRAQIYVAGVNLALAAGCIVLVLGFRSSAALAPAYGTTVALTMAITTALLTLVASSHWRWSRLRITLTLGSFLLLDLAFLGANLLKIQHGGWLSLVLAGTAFVFMLTWHRGRAVVGQRLLPRLVRLEDLISQLAERSGVRRVRGTAVFLTSNPVGAPIALTQNIEHNRVIHDRVLILRFETSHLPHIPPQDRVSIEELPHGFWRINARFGFMEDPEIGPVREACAAQGLDWNDFDTTYFLGRESIVQSAQPALPRWRIALFSLLSRNAQEPAAFFRLPANRVVELGVQIEV